MGGEKLRKGDVLVQYQQHLLQRFGPTAKEQIAEEVGKLSTRGTIRPQDLKAVEDRVVTALRGERSQAGSDVASVRSGSTGRIGRAPRAPKSDAGRSTASVGQQIVSGRQTPKFVPTVEIPRRPIQRVPDQWDLILRYDQTKFNEEERGRVEAKRALQMRYKGELDRQMEEIHDRRQFYTEEKERDREAIMLEQERIQRDEALEHQRQKERNKAVLEGCEQALRARQKKQEREQALLARERDELLQQVQREESEEAQKEAIRRERMRKRSQEISRHVQESIELKRKRKLADAAEERKMMARYARELEQREEERTQALEDMKERMKRIGNTVGKMVGDSAADREREDERRMMETLRAAEEKSKEAEEERARVKAERLKAMKDCLQDQIQLKELRKRKEAAEMALQGKIWKEEAEEALAKDERADFARRYARKQLDDHLIMQLNVDGIDEEHRFRPDLRHREKEFNQDIFRQMLVDDFGHGEAEVYMTQPGERLPQPDRRDGRTMPFKPGWEETVPGLPVAAAKP